MTVVQLRELAREKRVRLPYGVNKAQIVQLLENRSSRNRTAKSGCTSPSRWDITMKNTARAIPLCPG